VDLPAEVSAAPGTVVTGGAGVSASRRFVVRPPSRVEGRDLRYPYSANIAGPYSPT
jgi:hypothetical protein